MVHELAHRRHMNHSPLFWAEVERYFPDFQECRKQLGEYGLAQNEVGGVHSRDHDRTDLFQGVVCPNLPGLHTTFFR